MISLQRSNEAPDHVADGPKFFGRRSVIKWSSAAIVGALAFGGRIPGLTVDRAFAQSAGGAMMKKGDAVDLGKGDVGVLNYAFALEQLEAAFYTQAVKTPYSKMESADRDILTTIRDHEIAHREFFRAALKDSAIPDLDVDFTKVNFGSRDSVLSTAQTFEDLGVAAYNGAGKLLEKGAYLLLAGKIVSVEARHAAAIRDLMHQSGAETVGSAGGGSKKAGNGPFGNGIIGDNGLDQALMPSEVLPKAAPFIKTKITANGLAWPARKRSIIMTTETTILAEVDPEIAGHMTSRRGAFREAALRLGAAASAPVILGSLASQAFGKDGELPEKIRDVLNFALTLEYLEDEFYRKGLEAKNLIPDSSHALFEQIGKHETAHVSLLKDTLGSHATKKPEFDFTAGGKFGDVFSNYETFLALSQAFEDTGVRAYKGQAGNLIENDKLLTVALQIHSVEARHAAHVRHLRKQSPWIVSNSRGNLPEATQPIYDGEADFTQGGVDLMKLSKDLKRDDMTLDSLSGAFDEPLSKEKVLAIASLFIKKT